MSTWLNENTGYSPESSIGSAYLSAGIINEEAISAYAHLLNIDYAGDNNVELSTLISNAKQLLQDSIVLELLIQQYIARHS